MDRFRIANTLAMFFLGFALLAQPGLAAPDAGTLAAPLGSAFVYEGRLSNLTGTYDFQFRLFDAATGGVLVGTPTTVLVNNAIVTQGEYQVVLNFGAIAFAGDARYLEVGYRAGTSTGAYSIQTGRKPILPVAYALSLKPGTTVRGALPNNTALIQAETISQGAIGLRGDSRNGVGTWGQSTNEPGIFGRSFFDHGVYGETSAEFTSTVAGVYGKALQRGGIGVIGDAQIGNGWGVSGLAKEGVGVRGEATTGIGVSGYSTSGSAGVYGKSSGANASGVEGNANGANAAGVYGKNVSGRGVWGYTDSGTAGVYGQSNGGSGSGVEGYANNGSNTAGVYGRSSSGVGVWGRNEAGGYAMKAEGNATQSSDKGGWVKAMVVVDYTESPTITRCFNSQLTGAQVQTAPCGFTASNPREGRWSINFGFDVSQRFASVTTIDDAGCFDGPNAACRIVPTIVEMVGTRIVVDMFTVGGYNNNTPFILIVY